MRVFFIEEPVFDDATPARLELHAIASNLTVGVPHLPRNFGSGEAAILQRDLLDEVCARYDITNPYLWFYTPMAITFAGEIPASAIIYDCMDELSAFKDAPAELPQLEGLLLDRADLVFTGGFSLFEAKRGRHPRVYAFPSAVDVGHFGTARGRLAEPADQAAIPRPRLGFFGVIDERMDTALLAVLAGRRPDWHFVMIGPVVKIDPASLPKADNIHYLGMKDYQELPAYAAHWEAALMPFALNDATRFISPTKMPEYLAAGKPVISTPVADVTRLWGHLDATFIAENPDDFASKAAAAIALAAKPGDWLDQVDRDLAELSWDRTWERMQALILDLPPRQSRLAAPA
jgi:UDP-galactopyranose mutase